MHRRSGDAGWLWVERGRWGLRGGGWLAAAVLLWGAPVQAQQAVGEGAAVGVEEQAAGASAAGEAAGAAVPSREHELSEVEVTGKRPEGAEPGVDGRNATLTDTPWIELPQSVQTVDLETLEEWGVGTVEDAWEFSAGVQPSDQALGSRYGGTARVRGLTGSQTVLNGFALPQRVGMFLGMAGVESITFMKGSADSVDGGQTPGFTSGGFGGQINVNSKAPGAAPSYGLALSGRGLGNDEARLLASVDQPLLGETLALRVDGGGAFGRKFYVPAELDAEYDYTLAPSLLWRPYKPLKVTLRGIWQRNRAYAYQGIAYIRALEVTRPDKTTERIEGPGRLQPYDGWLGDEDSTVESTIALSQLEVEWALAPILTANLGLSYVRQDVDTNLWTWSVAGGGPTSGANATSYEQMIETGASIANYMDYDSSTENLAGRFNLVGDLTTGWWRHQAVLGADVEKSETESTTTPWVADTTPVPFEDPVVPSLSPGTPGAPSAPYHTYRVGMLAQYQAEITRYLRLLAGLRLDSHEYESTAYTRSAPYVGTTTTYDKKVPSYRAGLTILPIPSAALYGNVTTGAQPLWGLKDVDGEDIDEAMSYRMLEIGVKAEPLRGLRLSAAWFSTKQENIAESVTVTNPDGSTAVAWELTGEAEYKGYELAAQGQITPSWGVMASYAYVESDTEQQYSKYHNLAPHTVSAFTSYRLPGLLRDLRLGAGYRFVDERGNCHVGSVNCDVNTLPAYHVADMLAEYQLPAEIIGAKSWFVRMNASNVFDSEYYTRVRMYTQTSVGEPMAIQLSMKADW